MHTVLTTYNPFMNVKKKSVHEVNRESSVELSWNSLRILPTILCCYAVSNIQTYIQATKTNPRALSSSTS